MSAWGNRRLKLAPETAAAISSSKEGLIVPEHALKGEVDDIKRPTRLLESWELDEIFRLLESGEHPDRMKYGIALWEMDELIEHYKMAKEGNIHVDAIDSIK